MEINILQYPYIEATSSIDVDVFLINDGRKLIGKQVLYPRIQLGTSLYTRDIFLYILISKAPLAQLESEHHATDVGVGSSSLSRGSALGQVGKAPGLHPGDRKFKSFRAHTWGVSSIGRAPPLHGEG